MENPLVDDERTLLTPAAPFMDVSMGNVTSCSTSSAARPDASVMTTTVGAFRSGNTSTSVLEVTKIPATISKMEAVSMMRRLWRE